MSEEKTEQAVVDETKAPPAAGAEVKDAREDGDDLDVLLKQFEPEQKTAPVTQPEQKTETAPKVDEGTTAALTEVQRFIFRQDMEKTVKSVRGDLDPEYFDDDLVKSWINAQAEADPRLAQAWTNRHANPKQFQKVVDTLGRNFVRKYGKAPTDKNATEDREAVTAAVRGASTKAPEGKPPDLSRLSPAEFQAEKEKMFGG